MYEFAIFQGLYGPLDHSSSKALPERSCKVLVWNWVEVVTCSSFVNLCIVNSHLTTEMEPPDSNDNFEVLEISNTLEDIDNPRYMSDYWSEEKRECVVNAMLALDPTYEFRNPDDYDMAAFKLQNHDDERDPDKSPLYPFLASEQRVIHIVESLYDKECETSFEEPSKSSLPIDQPSPAKRQRHSSDTPTKRNCVLRTLNSNLKHTCSINCNSDF